MQYSRIDIAKLIINSLKRNKESLKQQYHSTRDQIGFFFLDNVLPKDLAIEIYENFPPIEHTVLKKSLKEYKYVAYQMNKYNSILEELVYAFQNEDLIDLIKEICELKTVWADESLYAGGLSLMNQGNFLNPHLDNSHDKDRNNWRVLNLLYYVTPNWEDAYGGNLELWTEGLDNDPVTITSKFNRLVVMATHHHSWHSVSKIKINLTRCCVSNYYFSSTPLIENDTFHVTSFRGRPSQRIRDSILKMDNSLRMLIRKFFHKGIRKNPHQYKK